MGAGARACRPVEALLSRLEALRAALAGAQPDRLSTAQVALLVAAVPPLFGMVGSSANSPTLALDRSARTLVTSALPWQRGKEARGVGVTMQR